MGKRVMKVNYFFLWHYNKFPFVYSLMKENEENILVINIQDSHNLKDKLSALSGLDRISRVILVENTLSEYFFNLIYRLFIYPFKIKKNRLCFYLDGFVGYYPLFLANIGLPDEVHFYEEGESIYQPGVLLKKKVPFKIKSIIGFLIKNIFFVKKNSIHNIKSFYVRDKDRLLSTLTKGALFDFNFEIKEINDVEAIKKLSNRDKELLKKIFLADLNCDFSVNENEKRAIVLTQPLYLYGIYSKKETIDLFNQYISGLANENYKVYVKLHPVEREDLYAISDGVQRIGGEFPFELLALLNVCFDKGVTYNSTAVNSKLIRNKHLIKDD